MAECGDDEVEGVVAGLDQDVPDATGGAGGLDAFDVAFGAIFVLADEGGGDGDLAGAAGFDVGETEVAGESAFDAERGVEFEGVEDLDAGGVVAGA